MFDTIEELVTEAIADGGYDEEFVFALQAELSILTQVEGRITKLWELTGYEFDKEEE